MLKKYLGGNLDSTKVKKLQKKFDKFLRFIQTKGVSEKIEKQGIKNFTRPYMVQGWMLAF